MTKNELRQLIKEVLSEQGNFDDSEDEHEVMYESFVGWWNEMADKGISLKKRIQFLRGWISSAEGDQGFKRR